MGNYSQIRFYVSLALHSFAETDRKGFKVQPRQPVAAAAF